MADTFPALRAAFEGRDDLLDLPLDAIADRLADERAAELLLDLAEHVSAKDLRALVGSDEASRLLARGLIAPSRQRLLSGLSRLARAEDGLVWRAKPPPSTPVEPPPPGKAALAAWVKKHRVEAWLGAPARLVRPFVQVAIFLDGGDGLITVQDLLEGRGPVSRVARNLAGAYESAARTFLRYRAMRALKQREREERWAERPAIPALRALSVRLHEALETLDADTEAPVFLVGDERLRVELEPPGVAMSFREGPRVIDTRIGFAGYEDGPVALEVTGGEPERSPQLRALLEWTLDAVHDPAHGLHATLAFVLAQPTWTRFVDALAASLEAAREVDPDRRIVWRVEEGGPRALPNVVAAVQKRSKTGRWSSGSTVAADKLEAELVGEADLPIVDALSGVESLDAASRERRLARALRLLVGHPRVQLDKDRLVVREVAPTLALVPIEGGDASRVRLSLRVGETEVPAARVAETELLTSFEGTTLFIAPVEPRLARVAEAIASFPSVLPTAAHDRVLALLPRLQPAVELAMPSALRGEPREADGTLVARLVPDEQSLTLALRVRPLGGDGTWPAGRGPALVFGLDAEGKRVHAARDLADESKRARALRDELERTIGERLEPATTRSSDRSHDEIFRLEDLERALGLLTALEEIARRGGVVLEWPSKRWKQVGVASSLRVRVKRAGAWLGVDGDVEVEGKSVPLSALLSAVRAGQRYVQVSPGRFAAIEEDLRARLEGASDVLFEGEEGLTAGLAAAAELRELATEVEGDEWLELLDRMERASHEAPNPPAGLNAELRGYQLEGFRWLSRLSSWGAGACLADEMGLGKTVQALAVLLARKDEGPALVVAPTSVGAGWEQEAGRFAPELRVIAYRGPGRGVLLEGVGAGDVIVTSYDILARHDEALMKLTFGTIIFDEAQALKNARTQRVKAARQLNAKWRLGLTGTPLENHLGELWSLFAILSPGFLGSWTHFQRRYATPIERDGDAEKRAQLAERLRPFLLRRTKKQVTPELPPRIEVLRPVELGDAERALYESARREALTGLVGADEAGGKRRFDVLAAMTRLRLLSCHPRLVDAATTAPSAKLTSFLELVEELREDGHRALVFSQFTSLLRIVRDALDLRGIHSLYLDGSTPAKKRADLVKAWQDGDDPLFLISLKAGGTGLNLTAADTVIHLDPWWNPAVEDQASDRAHRIGQDKPVTIVRLVVQETIEESVLALHGEKRALFEGVLEGSGDAAQLGVKELVALIRGDTFDTP
ncbi:MAG: DEAD/DEAH box helicase [Myxococcales bacterium]|nr:DEAD/DEAH box helicase [Myxococcales bacterium]